MAQIMLTPGALINTKSGIKFNQIRAAAPMGRVLEKNPQLGLSSVGLLKVALRMKVNHCKHMITSRSKADPSKDIVHYKWHFS